MRKQLQAQDRAEDMSVNFCAWHTFFTSGVVGQNILLFNRAATTVSFSISSIFSLKTLCFDQCAFSYVSSVYFFIDIDNQTGYSS